MLPMRNSSIYLHFHPIDKIFGTDVLELNNS